MPVMLDNTLSALTNIQIKVRRLTRSSSASQITDAQINDYINTFILYDLPENSKIFSLRKTFSFYCEPYIDRYSTNTTDITNQFYNFKNQYLSIDKQITMAGFPALLSESRTQFYGIYPLTNSINTIAYGNGITTNYAGVLTTALAGFGGGFVPIIRGEVLFSSVDINNNGLAVSDQPVAGSAIGNLITPTSIYNTPTVVGTINYLTGAYTINFPVAPKASKAITSQTIPFVPSRPQAILYYDKITYTYPKFRKIAYCYFLEGFVYENQMNDLINAKKYYTLFITKYPTHPLTKDAKILIENLGKSPEELIKGFEEKQNKKQI